MTLSVSELQNSEAARPRGRRKTAVRKLRNLMRNLQKLLCNLQKLLCKLQ
jgi:hypothetical protein